MAVPGLQVSRERGRVGRCWPASSWDFAPQLGSLGRIFGPSPPFWQLAGCHHRCRKINGPGPSIYPKRTPMVAIVLQNPDSNINQKTVFAINHLSTHHLRLCSHQCQKHELEIMTRFRQVTAMADVWLCLTLTSSEYTTCRNGGATSTYLHLPKGA